ncbi:hypothetical protein [Microbacterium sp. K2]|uniref:hypothetical protein n=1 Tax=Microbacterium sp. K2 TaxID=3391827 RepID=UPI003ED9D69C
MSSMLSGLEIEGQNAPIQPGYGQGATESETRAAIAEISAENPLSGIRRTLSQAAIALAISIDRGNNKGRSVANDVQQLVAIMMQLAPAAAADETVDDGKLTPEMRRLLDAFEAPAQFDAAPEGDPAEL